MIIRSIFRYYRKQSYLKEFLLNTIRKFSTFSRPQFSLLKKDELIQHLGEPLLYSGIVLDGTVEGSFINENYSKINMNHFERGRSFAEALACVQTPYSPIQLKALTNCTIMLINLKGIISGSSCPCSYQLNLTTNMLKILASQNVFQI